MPSGLSQLRSTCIMPWLSVAASWGSSLPAASLRLSEPFNFFPADSNASTALLTALRSSDPAFGAFCRALEMNPLWKLPDRPQAAQAGTGSFDFVAASLRESSTPLRMTEFGSGLGGAAALLTRTD